MRHKLLLIDDDVDNLKVTSQLLEHFGYAVTTMNNPIEALRLVKTNEAEFSLVIIDQHMPEMTGTQFANELKLRKLSQQVLIYSCDSSKELLRESWKSGAVDFLEKDSKPEELLKAVKSFCVRYDELIRLAKVDPDENSKLIQKMGMVGRSRALSDVCQQIEKFAPFVQTVLIHGETGVGKELVAKAVHNLSPRSKNKFVAVNCGAIPDQLVESTLFGHIKGAFTSATSNQQGKFHLADGGTLFLDEIGELDLEVQAKLLRAIQEKVIEPVGAKDPIKIDVRIIAATHRDLKQMVADGKFRADLYHRINVLELNVPALRERPEDIEPLVQHFAESFAKEIGRKISFLSSAVQVLRGCEWRGNIRELKNVVEKHLAKCEGQAVRKEDLDASLFQSPTADGNGFMTWQQHQDLLRQQSLKFLEDAVSKSPNKAQAADRLGVTRQYLHKLFANLG